MNAKKLDTLRRCITGEKTTSERCVGYCNNKNHIGYVTVPILKRRQCIEKNCSCFYPIKEHPYWNQLENSMDKKTKRKGEIKFFRDNEKNIPNILNIPEDEFLFCKHLYENIYIIVCKEGFSIDPIYCCDDMIIYGFTVSERKEKNIDVTYTSLLTPEILEKKNKNDQKNRER